MTGVMAALEANDDVRAARLRTDWLDGASEALADLGPIPREALLAAVASDLLGDGRAAAPGGGGGRGSVRPDPWTSLPGWRVGEATES